MRARRKPVGQAGFERGVGDEVCARRTNYLNVVQETFACVSQSDLQIINWTTVIALTVVEQTGGLDGCPRRFGRFIAIAPIGRQAMIAAWIDQLEAAAAALGPVTPTSSGAVSHFIPDDINDICLERTAGIGADKLIRHRKRKPLALASKRTAEVSHGIVAV